MFPSATYLLFGSLITSVLGDEPIVKLSYGSFQGKTTNDVLEFLGIPFAAPPVGNLRFAPPKNPLKIEGVQQATAYGPSCPYLIPEGNVPGGGGTPSPMSEDCLHINVVRPGSIPYGKKLPVVFVGDTSQYPLGSNIVRRSLTLNEPVIFVSANYRTNAFGFLGGQEVKDAKIANAGLRDQRFALEWVQKYIGLFGGDRKKVTLWGESAGAISVGLQYLLDDGNGYHLFRGGFMQSGVPIVLPDISRHQRFFDQLVKETNCTGSADKIACLRAASFDDLQAAIGTLPGLFSFQSLELNFQPNVDGDLIKRDPLTSIIQGQYAKLPFVTGNCEDEGTLFSLATLNLTTSDQYIDFIHSRYFERATAAQIAALAEAYPDDITQGSPFNTGTANALTPQFKRFAAIQGDIAFQAPRRFFSKFAARTQPAWEFRFMARASPPLGFFHGSDVGEFFGAVQGTKFIGLDALIHFVYFLNPNAPANSISATRNFTWPRWTPWTPTQSLFTIIDAEPGFALTEDTYRKEAMELLNELTINEIGNGI
ncbi:hypothetical protein NLJ89_g4169 [Agrocybe chaxingu]|uniref:Carboxylic ester hydrolase n=1 Tax=Agrocybe chaxingu TaxID=84603 RepID=A0A9W8MUT5_9AGAR|nr:hypothetical protein NLJ89_g4169 [Agrocybe chaxingu]